MSAHPSLLDRTAPDGAPTPTEALLGVRDLRKSYPMTRGLFGRTTREIRAVDGVSFDLMPGMAMGLVGESGCGKSTTSRMILRLTEPTSGRIVFEGRDITHISEAEMKAVRRRLQIVLQDPFSFLNPQLTAAHNVEEALRVQGLLPRGKRRDRVAEVFRLVGLKPSLLDRMPYELSGGERQRVGIARAIVMDPSLIVLDEAVSALDVSVRAQVINLLRALQAELRLTYLFVSHDLAVVRSLCSAVAVMYLGKIVEMGSRDAIFGNPQHPYTQTLLSSIPLPDPRKRLRPRFPVIGELPSAANPPRGCRFHTRCWKAQSRCTLEEPALAAPDAGAGQSVACHFPEPVAGALAAAQRSARGRASGKPEAARTERGAANGVD